MNTGRATANGIGQPVRRKEDFRFLTGRGSFADDVSLADLAHAATNRLGVRSGVEGGTTPALAAVVNAIVDALADLGVRHLKMPATPERVWRAIRSAAAERM